MAKAVRWMSVGWALLAMTLHAPAQAPRVHDFGKEGLSLNGKLDAGDAKLRVQITQEKHGETPAQLHLVKLPAGRNYRIVLESPDFDSVLVVQSEDGQQLAWDDDSGGGLHAALTLPVIREGTYRIGVTSGEKFGRYKLSIQDEGRLEVLDVGAGLTRKGRIGPTPAITYCVRLDAGKPYLVEMASADPKTLDPYLRVTDAGGREIVTDDDAGGGVNARLVIRPETTGVYPIIATSFRLEKGEFTLSVRRYGIAEAKAIPQAQIKYALDQASELWSKHRLAQAASMFEILLPWMEAIERPDGGHIAEAYENLCSTYSLSGRLGNAEWAALKAVEVRESRVGKDHVDVARSLISLGGVYLETGRYAEGLRAYARSLALRESKHGANHPSLAASLSGMASCLTSMGKTPMAEPLYRRSLRIAEANHGGNSEEVVQGLESLASFLADQMGRYPEAEPLMVRGLEVRRRLYPENHPNVAASLTNLARLYRYMEQYGKAEPLAVQAMQISEKAMGQDHVYVGGDALNLGLIYAEWGQHAKAEPLLLRGVQIFEKFYGPDNHALGIVLAMPATMYRESAQYDKAEPLYLRALRIAEATLGKEHPTVTETLHQLAWNHAGKREWTKAIERAQSARMRTSQYLAEVLPALSEQEQLALLEVKFKKSLELALSLSIGGGKDAELAGAEWLLNGKAVAHQALAEQHLLARDAASPAARTLVEKLKETRARLAAHLNRSPNSGQEAAYQAELRELKARERDQAQAVARAVNRTHRADVWIAIKELRRNIAKDAVFVDIARFPVFNFGSNRWGKTHYFAWIIPAADSGEVLVVDLGEAAPLDALVEEARTKIIESAKKVTKLGEGAALQDAMKPLQALAVKALHPLLPAIGNHPEWIFAPDGALWLAPWNALPLPGGEFAVEKYRIRHVVSGRDLIQSDRTMQAKSAALFADPDYDLAPGKAAASELRGPASSVRGQRLRGAIGTWNVSFEFLESEVVIYDEDAGGAVAGKGTWQQDSKSLVIKTGISRFEGAVVHQAISGERSKRNESGQIVKDAFHILLSENVSRSASATKTLAKVARLPGTALEAELIRPQIQKWLGEAPAVHLEEKASESLVKAVLNPRVLMLATHGYFLPAQSAATKARTDVDVKNRPTSLVDADGNAVENPLLRCGLLLAGCNRREEAKAGEDDGVLTGLEIVGIDLRGTELVVLSACETGLGEVRSGEGVAGLRQAFQLAGARTVLASLWQVPDRDTALLMNAFYGELTKGKRQVDALRDAQLARIAARRASFGAAHPFFWGAFTLTGQE